ncbi:hypothetical protein A9Q85_01750, partial [Cycloclasticus sp. 44_32_T64]
MAKSRTKATPPRKKPVRRQKKQSSGFFKHVFLKACLLFVIVLTVFVFYLDNVVRAQFEGKRWELPAHVFANPVEIYQGLQLSTNKFEALLKDLHYQ